jgi:carboxylesterase
MASQRSAIMPGAEPFFYPGGDSRADGCLCLHGLGATPHEVAWLGAYLAHRGVTTYGPRIAGHGTDYNDLRRVRMEDWYVSALDGYHLLRGCCSRVFIAGLSMGGLLSLLVASALPVDGVIIMAAPVQIPGARLLPRARWIKYIRSQFPVADITDFPQRLTAEQEQRGEPALGRVRYNIWPTHALEQFHRLMIAADACLPQVTAPTLLLYSEADATVPLINRDYIRQRLGSDHIETYTFLRSGHILTQDYDRDEVFQRVGDFITKA